MSEIDRINPIVRPIVGPRSIDRTQSGPDHRRQQDQPEDKLELSGDEPPILEIDDEYPPEPSVPRRDEGLDLSI